MKRHPSPIADISRSMAAKLGRARRRREAPAPARAMPRPLSVVFVALAVLASSVVFANATSAHEVSPEYSCESGELTGEQCLESADPVYSCSSGTLRGSQCEESADPVYSCSSGVLSGSQCRLTAAPSWSCSSGTLGGTRCTETADPTYSCSAGSVTGDRCLESANPVYSCSSGRLSGSQCEESADPVYSCSSGVLSGSQCRLTAAPSWSCSSGTLGGTRCTETADPTYSCSAGTPTGTRCLESANPVYSCSSGTLSGSRCLRTTDTVYSCSSGTLSGANCVTTTSTPATASCSSGTLSNGQCLHVTTANPGCPAGYQSGPFGTCYKYTAPVYSCSSGTLSGANCVTTTTTAATASCPSGYRLGIFSICYKYTAATSGCPAGFPPPAAGLCLKYTPATAGCDTGYTLSGSRCTRTTAAVAGCDTGYTLDTFNLQGSTVTYCYKDTAADVECDSGYILSGSRCTRTTAASSECPAGFPPPAAGLCLKYTAADAECDSGYTLSGSRCTRTTAAVAGCDTGYALDTFDLEGSTVTYCYKDTAADAECDSGYILSGSRCTRTTAASSECPAGFPPPAAGLCLKYTPATASCESGTVNNDNCDHTHPAITGLDATGTSAPGTDYTDNFTVAPATSTVLVSGAGCSLSGTAGSYTLTASRADAGTRTCTVAAADSASTTVAATITFGDPPTVTGLDATGTSAAGADYTDNFTVAPSDTSVSVTGTGCTVSGSAGSYTLTASRADAGTRTCTVSAGATEASATITFADPPAITGLEATGTSAPGADYTDNFTVAPATSTVLVSGAGCALSGTAGSYTLTASRADAGTRTCTVAAAHTLSATAIATITFGNPPAITGLEATGTSAIGADYTDGFTVAPTTATVSASGTGCSVTGSAGSFTLTASRADAGTRICTITATDDSIDSTASATITFANPPTITGLEATGTSAVGADYTDNFTVAPSTSTVLVSGAGCELSGTAGSYTLTARRSDSGTRTCTIAAAHTGSTTATATITFEPAPTVPTISGLDSAGTSVAGTAYADAFTVSPPATQVLAGGAGCSLSGTFGAYTLTVTRASAGTRTCSVTAGAATASATVAFAAAPLVDQESKPALPQSLRCSAATETTATWSWDAADGAHSYWYRYTSSGDWARAGGQYARSHTRTGVVPSASVGGWNNWRYLYLRAANNIGDGNDNFASCLTLPPDWLTSTCSSTGQITATWSKPLGLNSETSVGYSATATYGVTSVLGVGTLDPYTGTGTTHTFAGTPGIAYTIRAQTQPIAGKPAYSETTTVECEGGPPPSPTGVAVECTAANQVVVKWSGADGADEYKVTVAERWPATARPIAKVHTVSHRDLPAGQKLSLTVAGAIGWYYSAAVASVDTGPEPDLGSAPASSVGLARCTGVEVECQADARLKTTWVRTGGATRYRVRTSVTTTTSTQVATLPDVLVAQPAQAARAISHYRDAAAGNRYEVRVAAEANGTWAADSAPAADTCVAAVPPKPTGVTASCSKGVLTIEWDTAGTGLAEATSYKPRIFTGTSMTPDTRWTANTTATTATLPATGQESLPATGIFKVKVKAANTAGDSAYSDPAETTCGKPGPIAGLKCTAITKDQITIEWNTAVGADTYAVTGRNGSGRGAHIVYGDKRTGDFTTDVASDLRDDASYALTVVATNTEGTSNALVNCRTLDDNWLEVDCPASNAMLHITWDNSIDGSQNYSVTIINEDSTWIRTSSTASSWVLPGQPEQEYSVDIASAGVPTYSQSKTKSCPKLDPFGRKHDPFLWPQEGGIDWPWEHDLDDEYTNFGYAIPFLITGVPEYQRTCSLSVTTWTCTEHWSEPAKVEIADSWRDDLVASSIQIVEADGLTDTERTALSNGINWSITRIAKAISWTKDKVLKAVIGRTVRNTVSELNLGEYILEMGDDNRVFAYLVGPTCLPNTIPQWKSAEFEMPDSIADQYTTRIAGYTVKRTYTVHYCKENSS